MKKLETLGFKHFCMTVGNLPSSYVESLSYYECLLWLIKYLQEEVIPTVNNNSEVVEELQGLYLELKSYVDNYFDNLDVQEEINNKLDEMVEEGTLQEIIADYLNSKAVFGFDTVSDMVSSTNLINGSYAFVYGHTSVNDKGQAHYKIRNITNEDVIDNYSKIRLTNSDTLIAVLNEKVVTPEMFGAVGDLETDDSGALQRVVDYSVVNGTDIIGEGKYLVSSTVDLYDDQNNTDYKLNVKLNYIKTTSDINVFKVYSNFANIEIEHIKGDDKGTAVYLAHGDSNLISHNNIKIGYIQNFVNGLYLYSDEHKGIQYNVFDVNFIQSCTNCIKLETGNNGTGLNWVNQNYFYNTRLYGNYGINIKAGTNSDYFNGNSFMNIGLEDISTEGIHLEKASYNKFYNIRNTEGLTGDYWLNADSDSQENTFEFTNRLTNTKVQCLGAVNYFRNGLQQADGFPISRTGFKIMNNQFDLDDNRYNTYNRINIYGVNADLSDASFKYFNINKYIYIGNATPNTTITVKINKILEDYTQFYVKISYLNSAQNAKIRIVNSSNTEIIADNVLTDGKEYLIKQFYDGTWKAFEQ